MKMSSRRRLAAWLALAVLTSGIGCAAAALAAAACCCDALSATADHDAAPTRIAPCCDEGYTLDTTSPSVPPPLSLVLPVATAHAALVVSPPAALVAAAPPRAELRALATRVLRL